MNSVHSKPDRGVDFVAIFPVVPCTGEGDARIVLTRTPRRKSSFGDTFSKKAHSSHHSLRPESDASYLRHNGFQVKVIPTNDLTVMGEKYGITDSLQPCHISLIGGYVVGGHIPIEVVNRLLSDKPQIAGITLPGMPEGRPGMPGKKPGPLQIYEIAKGPAKVYATV